MENLLDHYHSMYGSPSRRAEFIAHSGEKIQIYKWMPDQTNQDVFIYATNGSSMILGENPDLCEFFIGMTQPVDSIVDALAEVAMFGNGSAKSPSFGDSITLSFPLWKGTLMKTFLFTNGDQIIGPNRWEKRTVRFIKLVPLYESELKGKKEHGEDWLWRRFVELKVPYWNPKRLPAF